MTSITTSGVLVTLVALATGVAAQPHPCDPPAPTAATVTTGAPYKVQFCALPGDAPEALTVYLDGVASDLRPIALVVGPNALGLALYEGPRDLQFARGTYALQITIWNKAYAPDGPPQESAKSVPFSFSAVDGLPPATAPIIRGVVR